MNFSSQVSRMMETDSRVVYVVFVLSLLDGVAGGGCGSPVGRWWASVIVRS